ncbi:MAG TPA: hypothetical protein DIT58_16545 [Porticoccaceae bacterium]|nr:hypothetical protein [Porticoccaceae bacterium]
MVRNSCLAASRSTPGVSRVRCSSCNSSTVTLGLYNKGTETMEFTDTTPSTEARS